jgi:hypothetical protein
MMHSATSSLPNNPMDWTAGSRTLAAAAHRERYARGEH